MSDQMYDYSIIGAGAAGLQLALAMVEDVYFKDKHILIIDKEPKRRNDKTWCYWEKGKGQWDDLIIKRWDHGSFYGPDGSHVPLVMEPYSYKMLPSDRFYQHAHNILDHRSGVTWICDEVKDVIENENGVRIIGGLRDYSSRHCFDSRIDDGYHTSEDQYLSILQHFKGWYVRFEEDLFDPDVFTMMDFRLLHEGMTSFTYVLPTRPREALIEFTLFTKELLPSEQYDYYLKRYIAQYLGDRSYTVDEVEQGVIPMTNYPFHKSSSKLITKIGTAGSWVRPSTGYSFKYCERYVKKTIGNIKEGHRPDQGLLSKKTLFFDTILLDILEKKNHLGPGIFQQIYSKNRIQTVLEFLDGTSRLVGDLMIINAPSPRPFIEGLYHQYIKPF